MAAVHQPDSANGAAGTSSGNATTFAFPKSGLGTPDFFYFGGGSSAGTAGETPSWLKHPPKEEVKMEEHDAASKNAGKELKTDKSIEDGARHARALSDPPTRQSPAWLQPKNQHEHEPNPFEHSFSGKDYASMFHPPRRARSQSPKSSHGGGGVAGDINVPSSSGKGFTPGSADLGNFGWALQQTDSLRGSSSGGGGAGGATRGGPLTPRTAMLNGIAMTPGMRSSMAGGSGSNTAAHHHQDNMMFDPSSIRTGFTPGGINSGLHNAGPNNYPPHSPATQALFAMMTNATPGLPALPRVESEYSGSDSADNRSNTNKHPLQQAAHIQPSGNNSSGSGRSPESGNSGHVHAQAIPRPINIDSIYGNRPNPMAIQQASSNASSSYSGYQGSQNLLSQAVPRPMPPTAFSNNNNGLAGSQNPVPQMRGPPNPPAAGQNPLFLLSQQMQSDMPEDDTVLAAAALSGLSTPRGTYVGGPGMPTIAPGTLSNNAGKMNLQQPPSGLNPASRPAPLTKASTAAQPSIAPTASSNTVPKAGKKGATGPASNKRKKTDDSAAGVGGKKPKRNTRRAAAANAQPIVDADTPSEDEDDDGMSVGGSVGRSDSGRNTSYNYSSNNAAQSGSQMDMSMPGQGQRTNSGESEDKADGPRKGGRGPKQQFETEEEKRKNFLERNRQAALKCRQRKKQWLGELQQRVENLTQDNEVLQQTCNHLREEVMSLRNILLSHKDCPVGNPGAPQQQQQAAGMHGQVTIGGLLSAQAHQSGQLAGQMQQQRPPPPAPGRPF